MQTRDMQADLAKLRQISADLERLRNEATDLLGHRDPRAEVVLSQLGTVSQTVREYLPFAQELAGGVAERQEAVDTYLKQRYAVPKRGAA